MCVSGLLNLTYLPQNLKSWVFLKLFMTKIVRTRLTKLRTPRLYEFQHVRNAPAFEWGRTNPDFFYACHPVRRLKKRWFLYGNNFLQSSALSRSQTASINRFALVPSTNRLTQLNKFIPPVPYPLGGHEASQRASRGPEEYVLSPAWIITSEITLAGNSIFKFGRNLNRNFLCKSRICGLSKCSGEICSFMRLLPSIMAAAKGHVRLYSASSGEDGTFLDKAAAWGKRPDKDGVNI